MIEIINIELLIKILNNRELVKINQVDNYQKIVKDFKTNNSSQIAASVLNSSL